MLNSTDSIASSAKARNNSKELFHSLCVLNISHGERQAQICAPIAHLLAIVVSGVHQSTYLDVDHVFELDL